MQGAGNSAGRWLLILGAMGVTYGLVIGPAINALLHRDAAPGLYIVCVAVGLLAGVCGYGKRSGWSQ